MNKILVLCGGNSSERAVSLRSGAAVADALRAANYAVETQDVSADDETLKNCDVVFPVLHGSGGEDGTMQARLEQLGVVYVGSDAKSSKLCMDKDAYRTAMISQGFLMPEGEIVDQTAYFASQLSRLPHVLKPINGGSSVDTLIFRGNGYEDAAMVIDVFSRQDHMVLEQLIVGTELTVGILDQKPLPVIEIIPPSNEEFDYENKYNGKTQELLPPVHADRLIQEKVQSIALAAHTAAGCRDVSRSDFMIDMSGRCYLLETNTIPGMTSQSLYPKMALAAGLDMPALCDTLVRLAVERR